MYCTGWPAATIAAGTIKRRCGFGEDGARSEVDTKPTFTGMRSIKPGGTLPRSRFNDDDGAICVGVIDSREGA